MRTKEGVSGTEMDGLAFHVTPTVNYGGKFGLLEKYSLRYVACNYCPDYSAQLAGVRDRPFFR